MNIVEQDIIDHFNNSEDYIQIVDRLTEKHTSVLDNIIRDITKLLKQPDYTIDNQELESFYLKLSLELYNVVDKLKEFEIYSSLAKANESETYNNAYLSESISSDKKPAVAELQIRAELKTKKESLVNTVYASAFKNIKSKIEAGNSVLDTIKNVIKNRLSLEFNSNQNINNRSNI